MARTTLPKFNDDDDLNRLENVPDKVGDTFFEQLMAGPNQELPSSFSTSIRETVYWAIVTLKEDLKFAIELRYTWGKSYYEIMEMMGYQSKSSAYDKVKEAEQALKVKLVENAEIRNMLMKNESWDKAARFELDRITNTLKTGYKFNPELFEEYSYMMGEAVRTGADMDIVVWAWYTAVEAARFLDSQGIWDADELENVLVSKQHDYGHDNINAFGQIGIAVRLSDKIARYYNLVRRDREAKNEPFMDCLKDMVGYGVISAMLAAGTFDNNLEDESDE
jgi:hypothetical protein